MWLAFQVDLGRVRMNRLKLEQGEFTYSPEDAALKHTKAIVDIFVDGVNFIDEMRERIGHDAISPLYPDICYEKFPRNTGKERKESLQFFQKKIRYIFMQLLMRRSASIPIVRVA